MISAMRPPPVYLPMLASAGATRLQGDWAAEPKLDGWRCIVTIDPSLAVGVEVRSRTGRFLTPVVPELHALGDTGLRIVLDGELVSLGDTENIDFYALGQRMLARRAMRSVTFCAFDLLWLDDNDCTQLACSDRRRLLELLELNGPAWCTIPRYSVDDADDLLTACVQRGQEGIVLKRLDARYVPGTRSSSWRKVKTPQWRSDHGPRRLPNEIRERIVAAQLTAMARHEDI